MQDLRLSLNKRDVLGKKAKRLVEEGFVLGNVFGKGIDSIAVQGPAGVVDKVIKAAGKSQPIEIQIEGANNQLALVSDIERDNITQVLHHVSFHAIKRGEKVHAEVPIVLTGDAPAERSNLIVITVVDAVEVEAVPSKLPEKFELDKNVLAEVGDSITVADIGVGEGIVVLTDPETMIAKVEMPRAEVEEEKAEEEDQESAEGSSSERDEENEDADRESTEGERTEQSKQAN